MQQERKTAWMRSVKYGANVTVMTILVFAIMVMIEAISSRRHAQWDVTADQRLTLSPQTKQVAAALAADVKAIGFYSAEQSGERQAFDNLMTRYADLSPRISREIVDPDKQPGRAKTYDIKAYGTVVLETSDKQEKIAAATEEALTNALIKVTRKEQKTVYFLKGHGERALDEAGEQGFSLLKQAIEKQNYAVKELALAQQQFVPQDAALVVIGGAQKDLFPPEFEALRAYMKRGGNLFLLAEPDHAPSVAAFAGEFGLALGENIVIDRMSRMLGGGYDMPVVMQYQRHPITDGFNMMTFFPLARSVDAAKQLPPGVSAQPLLFSSPDSWAESSKDELRQGAVKFDESSDMRGPVPIAAVATIDFAIEPKKSAKLVVFGDVDFASNAYLNLSGNSDLFLNTVSWLAEEQDLIAIRAKNPKIMPLMLTRTQGRLAFLLSFVVLPVFTIGMGIVAHAQRRSATR